MIYKSANKFAVAFRWNPLCREPGCAKEFKRPCDLTKHEKTHSRPWKCPVESCKYHQFGWPTEKEMDRHHNDMHSAASTLYECHFKPCSYRSKRESNCKQHMEKADGWTYVRSKNNGKIRNKEGVINTNGVLSYPLSQGPSPLAIPRQPGVMTSWPSETSMNSVLSFEDNDYSLRPQLSYPTPIPAGKQAKALELLQKCVLEEEEEQEAGRYPPQSPNSKAATTAKSGTTVSTRKRIRLSPVAKAKAALTRHLGSCASCRTRKVSVKTYFYKILDITLTSE
jgi:hypothetical protein